MSSNLIARSIFLLLICSLGVVIAAAGGRAEGPFAVRVARVIDGDTLTLADGRTVRLVGIQAPKLALGRPGFVDWPLADEARQALAALVDGRPLTLAFGGRREDRHGRLLAHLFRGDDGLWVQGALLAGGFARVYTFADNRTRVDAMLAAERAARDAGRGLWAHPFYAVRDAERPREIARDRFELVVGRVVASARIGTRVYLNFGADWRRDFTVVLERPAARLYERERGDPLALEGHRIRVRGWVKWRNGPMIEVTHPEQIEELD